LPIPVDIGPCRCTLYGSEVTVRHIIDALYESQICLRYRIRACIGSSALSFIRALHVSAAYISRSSHTVFLGTSMRFITERLYFCMILSQCSGVKLRRPSRSCFLSSFFVRNFSYAFSSTASSATVSTTVSTTASATVSTTASAICQRLRQRLRQRLCQRLCQLDCVNVGYQPESMMTNLYVRVC
jgi:hypothetical protein